MKRDGESNGDFWKGVGDIPKRNQFKQNDYTDDKEKEEEEPETVMHIKFGERRHYSDEVARDILRGVNPEGTERTFQTEFTYAYDNVRGQRHSMTKTENATTNTKEQGLCVVTDRLKNQYPNCEISCIKLMED